jgi:hypothetical protein
MKCCGLSAIAIVGLMKLLTRIALANYPQKSSLRRVDELGQALGSVMILNLSVSSNSMTFPRPRYPGHNAFGMT